MSEQLADHRQWPLFEVWVKYEEITMHFNDLLIKLRTQALAAVAALATIVAWGDLPADLGKMQ